MRLHWLMCGSMATTAHTWPLMLVADATADAAAAADGNHRLGNTLTWITQSYREWWIRIICQQHVKTNTLDVDNIQWIFIW